MDFHGNINLKNNEMQKLVFQLETSFPTDAVVGTVVFKNKILYMAVAIGNDAGLVWIPLTESINTFVHDQTSAATAWTVTHNLGINNPVVQIYDSNHELIIPNDVSISTNLELVVTLNSAISGRAIVMGGDTIPVNGIGIIEPTLFAAWDITNAVYDNKSISLSSQLSDAQDATFNSDGTKLYTVSFSNTTVYQYSLSTAWDVSTATYDNKSLSVVASPTAILIGDNDTKLFSLGSGNSVSQYNLSVASDISTATFITTKASGGSATSVEGFSIVNGGTQMYVASRSPFIGVHQYTLGTAWDISTVTPTGTSLNVSATVSNFLFGMQISFDGTRLWVIDGNGAGKIYQYDLGTAYDITTGIYNNIFLNTTTQTGGTITDMHIGNNGNTLFVNSLTDVYQYLLS